MNETYETICIVGDRIRIRILNSKDNSEYSLYEKVITKEDLMGDGLNDFFLAETTGVAEEEIQGPKPY